MRRWLFVSSLLGTAWLAGCGRDPCPAGQLRIIDACYALADAGAPDAQVGEDAGLEGDDDVPTGALDAGTRPDGGVSMSGAGACARNPCGAERVCSESAAAPGYTCACKEGYAQAGGQCVDIDECFERTHSCHPSAKCENKPGTYDCTCPLGFAGGGREGFTCSSRIAVGMNHTCVLRVDGRVGCWGDNSSGQLGDGTYTSRPTLAPVNLPEETVGLSASYANTCALLRSGKIACWGNNDDGGLGDGTSIVRNVPTVVVNLTGAIALSDAVGSSHRCAVLNDGSARCWGGNESGQLGTAISKIAPSRPVRPALADTARVISIGTGASSTCAALSTGTVFCWGLGLPGADNGTTGPTPREIPDAGNATRVVVSSQHACAFTADHGVLCWGSEALLGRNQNDFLRRNIVQAGPYGELSDLALGTYHTVVAGRSGVVWGWNAGSTGKQLPVAGMDIVALSAQGTTTCGVARDGGVRCWLDGGSELLSIPSIDLW